MPRRPRPSLTEGIARYVGPAGVIALAIVTPAVAAERFDKALIAFGIWTAGAIVEHFTRMRGQ